MMMRRKLKEQMYDDDKPKIIKTEDYSKGSGFVELSGKKDQGKIPAQNVSKEKFRESGQLNKAGDNRDTETCVVDNFLSHSSHW